MNLSPTDDVRPSASSLVLDASALLALVFNEAGADVVEEAMSGDVAMSAVNLAEVVSRLVDYGLDAAEATDILGPLSFRFRVVDFGSEAAWRSGLLRSATKRLGLSLGDRACVALAVELDIPVLTADQAWSSLALGISVRTIR